MNAPDSIFTVQLGEAEIRVPREAAVMAYLEQEMDRRRPLTLLTAETAERINRAIVERRQRVTDSLAIGAEWQGGEYAGPTVYDNAPHRLVLLPGDVSSVDWDRAMKWAEEQGGTLPTRIDYLVLLANLRTRFKQDAYYWSCEQSASGAEAAWLQDVTGGNQGYWLKSFKHRARAVRRLPI